MVFNLYLINRPYFIISANQVIDGNLGVSWDAPFSDPESDVMLNSINF